VFVAAGAAAFAVVPRFFQGLGQAPGTLGLLVALPLALAAVGRWRSGLFVAVAGVFCVGILAQGMKNLVDRPRPAADGALGLYGPLVGVDHGSYPSGHVGTAVFAAVVIAALLPPHPGSARTIWWLVGVFLTVGMVWQRTLVNAHWLSDAVFGAVAGAGGALLMWWLFWPWLQRDYGRPLAFFGRDARPTGSTAHAAL
jgi:undecaprenyl-diphosphatase